MSSSNLLPAIHRPMKISYRKRHWIKPRASSRTDHPPHPNPSLPLPRLRNLIGRLHPHQRIPPHSWCLLDPQRPIARQTRHSHPRRLYRAETTLFPTNYTVLGLSRKLRLLSCCAVEERNCTVEQRKSSNVKAAEINPSATAGLACVLLLA